MKAVILAGGFGTRLSETSHLIPKPMVEIGGKPIIWHIMKTYEHYGIKDFIICCGYKQYVIKEYFSNYIRHNCDMTVNLADNSIEILDNHCEDWRVTMVDTGLHTMTGGRVKRIRDYVGNEPFMLTYGDGVSNINLKALEEFHRAHGKIATISAVNIGQRFGVLDLDSNAQIHSFREKNDDDGSLINGGFMVMNPEVFDYIEGDSTVFEKEPLENLAKNGQLMAYRHNGFWKCMDTQRDKMQLEEMWASGKAPWKTWK